MTRDLLYWSGIFICGFLLAGWAKLRFWEWLARREVDE